MSHNNFLESILMTYSVCLAQKQCLTQTWQFERPALPGLPSNKLLLWFFDTCNVSNTPTVVRYLKADLSYWVFFYFKIFYHYFFAIIFSLLFSLCIMHGVDILVRWGFYNDTEKGNTSLLIASWYFLTTYIHLWFV